MRGADCQGPHSRFAGVCDLGAGGFKAAASVPLPNAVFDMCIDS